MGLVPAHFAAFMAVAVVLTITPGPDFAIVTRNSLRDGRRAGLATALGVSLGLAVWTLASVAGIAALLAVSAVAFEVVKLAGAVYLIYLGLRSLVRSLRARSASPDGPVAIGRAADARASFRQGLLCNLLNPKAAVIFTSVIPQFVGTGGGARIELLGFGGVFVLVVLTWLSSYAVVAGGSTRLLARSGVRRAVDAVTGCALCAAGARLALERR